MNEKEVRLPMRYFEMAVLMILFLAVTALLIGLATGRIKSKSSLPGNVPWIFYLIEMTFGENNSTSKEVKRNELS
jgi:ABC-type transport system involved in cytochrome c biogenesis permease component